MEVDLASVEVIFAQKLACGEPVTRQRALKVLHDWIIDQSSKNPFTEADLMRLCKGLHYVMWMQDKMLLQEELADRIGNLLFVFRSEEEKIMYVKCFLNSLNKEWPHIDRWRMDKFLMEVRRMIRATFKHLKDLGWKKEIRDRYWDVFQETTISKGKSFNEGLKLHFASLMLDELDNAGGLTKKQTSACIKPYVDLLGCRQISDYLFGSIVDEILTAILLQKSEEIQAMEEEEDGIEQSPSGIQFNYKEIAKMLFDAGKKPEVTSKRRSRIYGLVKKFEKCAAQQDPLHFEVPEPKEILKPEDFDEATERFIKLNEDTKEERKRAKKAKMQIRQKMRAAEEKANKMETEDNSNNEDDEELEVVKKSGGKGGKIAPKVKKAKKSSKVKGVGKKVLMKAKAVKKVK